MYTRGWQIIGLVDYQIWHAEFFWLLETVFHFYIFYCSSDAAYNLQNNK